MREEVRSEAITGLVLGHAWVVGSLCHEEGPIDVVREVEWGHFS